MPQVSYYRLGVLFVPLRGTVGAEELRISTYSKQAILKTVEFNLNVLCSHKAHFRLIDEKSTALIGL